MVVVSMKQLLESGVHFGHQSRKWNPKMRPYIFAERNGIHILDLEKTLQLIEEAYNFVKEVTSQGQLILFVGTKKQAQEAIEEEAKRCEMPYVNYRWLGGTLTNFTTIKKRVERLKQLQEMMLVQSSKRTLPKKEILKLQKEQEKLERNFGGIKGLTELPGAIFVVDLKKEEIAVREARRLEIPLVGMVDTNCDPEEIDYVIPSNDDAIRAIALVTRVIANAAFEGKEILGVAEKTRKPVENESKSKVEA